MIPDRDLRGHDTKLNKKIRTTPNSVVRRKHNNVSRLSKFDPDQRILPTRQRAKPQNQSRKTFVINGKYKIPSAVLSTPKEKEEQDKIYHKGLPTPIFRNEDIVKFVVNNHGRHIDSLPETRLSILESVVDSLIIKGELDRDWLLNLKDLIKETREKEVETIIEIIDSWRMGCKI